MVFAAPSVKVVEEDRGALIPPLATHITLYLFGTTNGGSFDGEFNQPYLVRNGDQFVETFGTSNQLYVDLIFANNPNSLLQFIPVKKELRYSIEVPLVVVDETTYSFSYTEPDNTVNSITYTVSQPPDDYATVVNSLLSQLNGFEGVTASIDNDNDNFIDVKIPSEGLIDNELNVTLNTIGDGVTAVIQDFIDALNDFAILPDPLPGFILFPEAFENFTTTSDRTLLTNTLETVAVTHNSVGIVDGIDTDNVNDIVTDRNLYGSPRGHLAYFSPWVKVLDSNSEVTIPPSPAVASIWAYYVSTLGVKKSPLGSQKVISGITGLSQKFTLQDSEIANPNHVNLLLKIKRSGNVIWGGRTMSNNPNYQFCNGRVIMNVINETAETAFLPFIGRTIDIKGGIFHDLRNTGNAILFRLFAQGALYGNDATEAYLVVCDDTNNPKEDLETGLVQVDMYAKCSPTLERVLVTTIKVPLNFEF